MLLLKDNIVSELTQNQAAMQVMHQLNTRELLEIQLFNFMLSKNPPSEIKLALNRQNQNS